MSNATEYVQDNKQLIQDLFAPTEAMQKKAAEGLTRWLRTYQRQDGVFRKIMVPEPITDGEFDVAVETNAPFVIRQIVPHSAGALSVNFDTGTVMENMDAPRYRIYLERIWTPVYKTDKIYLVSFRGSLIDVFHDLMLQDILAQEDMMGMKLVQTAVGEKGVVNPVIGCKQWIDVGDSITTKSVTYAVSGMTYADNGLNPSQALIHRSFWWELIATFRACDQGPVLAERAVLGDAALLEEKMAGVMWRTVLNRKLVPRRTMYVFAAPEYLGNFLTYGEASIFTKAEADIWLSTFAHETIGMSMPNRAAAFRADFTGVQDCWIDDDEYADDESTAASLGA